MSEGQRTRILHCRDVRDAACGSPAAVQDTREELTCGHWRDKMASQLFVEVRITDYSISYRFVRLYGVSKKFSLFKVMRCVILSISATIIVSSPILTISYRQASNICRYGRR
jgi:hypothetical protein